MAGDAEQDRDPPALTVPPGGPDRSAVTDGAEPPTERVVDRTAERETAMLSDRVADIEDRFAAMGHTLEQVGRVLDAIDEELRRRQ